MRLPVFCASMLAGCSLNVAILLWGRSNSQVLVEQPGFAYWLFFIGVQGAIWWPLALHLAPLVRRNLTRSVSAPDHAGAFILAALTFIAGFAFYQIALDFGWISARLTWPLYGHNPKLKILTCMGMVPACLAVLGMAYASAASGNISGEPASAARPAFPARIKDMIEARESFDLCLKSLGLLLSVATLSTAALRNTVVAYGEACASYRIACPDSGSSAWAGFPLEMVIMFGLGFTAILILVAVPTGLRIHGNCEDLIRQAVGGIPHSPADLKAWLEHKDSLKKAIGLEGGLVRASKEAILILGPLLSALLSTLFPG